MKFAGVVLLLIALAWYANQDSENSASSPASAVGQREGSGRNAASQHDALYARIERLGLTDWSLESFECADGWRSPSIGEQGACSWHGGVVAIWRNKPGISIRCPDDTYPPLTEELIRQSEMGIKNPFCVESSID